MGEFVDQELLDERKDRAIREYPGLWSRVISEWKEDGADNVWLLYSANYLFRTGGIRWAMDPIRLQQRVPEAAEVPAESLDNLSFVVLTHQHRDHLDIDLIRELRDMPIRWVIPEFLVDRVIEEAGLRVENITIPRHLEPLQFGPIMLTPFDGMHWENTPGAEEGQMRGVPSMGFLLQFNQKRWLFPGDTRTYDASLLPSFGPVDGLFAHLWLGRQLAQADPPPLLEAFCRFCLDLQPAQIIVTHLNELGRDANDLWHEGHFRAVQEVFRRTAPSLPVSAAYMGDRVSL